MGRNFLFTFLTLFLLSYESRLDDNLVLPCAGCHATEGKSMENSTIPPIAGLEESYFIKAFEEYKNNLRKNYVMRIIAKGYSKDEVILMAKYFSKN